jgi:hypothetical protein
MPDQTTAKVAGGPLLGVLIVAALLVVVLALVVWLIA